MSEFVLQIRRASKRRSCTGCLWNWENLRTGKEKSGAARICYEPNSPHYHQEAAVGCTMYERRTKVKMTLSESSRLNVMKMHAAQKKKSMEGKA